MNSITVQGNLVRDVRVVYTEKGTPIINFCLADNGFVKGEMVLCQDLVQVKMRFFSS